MCVYFQIHHSIPFFSFAVTQYHLSSLPRAMWASFHHSIFSFLTTASFLFYHPISNPVPHLSTFALSSRLANPFFINTMMSSTLLGKLQNITFTDALSQSHADVAPKLPNSYSYLTRRTRVALVLRPLQSISQTHSHT